MTISTLKKTLAVAAGLTLAVVLFATSASSAEACLPCGAPAPVVEPAFVPAGPPVLNITCDVCATGSTGPTALPGYYSNDYDNTQPLRDTSITYLVPSPYGLVDAKTQAVAMANYY